MELVDRANTHALKRIIDAYGWPGADLVGDRAANAAWLLAQHADADADFQDRALALMTQAAERGAASRSDLAYLIDRCLVRAGEPQLYGTQYTTGADGLLPQPVADPAKLDERRAEVGLEPHAGYHALMHAQAREQAVGGSSPERG